MPVIPSTRTAWPRWWASALAWALWALALLGLAATAWLDQLLRQAGLPHLSTGTGNAVAAAAVFLLAQVVAPMPLYPEYPDIGSPIGVPALADPPLDAVVPVAGLVVLVGLVVGAGSLLGRFRHARGVERQQLRWLAWGAALAAVASLVAFVDLAMHGGNSPLFQTALGVCVALLPLATGAAILRYRLYDIDRIVSRTLAYGLLTLLLGIGYAGWCSGSACCCPKAPAWPWPRRRWLWPQCSSRPAAASRMRSTGASTAAATTPPARSRRSLIGCGRRSTWRR
jgi:hypothetical protein